jgi:hypothetical protein
MTPDSQTMQRTHSVILRLGDRFCSLPVDCVREMTVLPEIKKLCGTSAFVPGVITLRGEAIPVVDLRMRLGMSDVMDDNRDLIRLLEQREQDHLSWLAELEACIHEERHFSLGLDPTACKFGRWMSEFEPGTRELAYLMQGFAGPHIAIHGIGKEVMQLAESGRKSAALERIEETRATELNMLLQQFRRVYDLLSAPPRLIVDEVASLAWVRFEEGDISREAVLIDGLFASMGRNEATNAMVSMLNPHGLRVHAA